MFCFGSGVRKFLGLGNKRELLVVSPKTIASLLPESGAAGAAGTAPSFAFQRDAVVQAEESLGNSAAAFHKLSSTAQGLLGSRKEELTRRFG